MSTPHPSLRDRLEPLYSSFNQAAAQTDPIELVRPYASPADREVAGFIAAALAFGQVGVVMHSVGTVLKALGPSPSDAIGRYDPVRDRHLFEGFVHRWIRGTDVTALLWVMRQMLDRAGSIEAFFLEGDDGVSPDVCGALESFSSRALALDLARAYGAVPGRPGVAYFFPRPSQGSACKRLNLFLRWMVRRDAVDLGVWTRLNPGRLIVPLDTHVIRLAQCLRLTRYRSPGWRMAQEITASLRVLDSADPVRFDFAICHVGMMGGCKFGVRGGDAQCPLRGACRPVRRQARQRRG